MRRRYPHKGAGGHSLPPRNGLFVLLTGSRLSGGVPMTVHGAQATPPVRHGSSLAAGWMRMQMSSGQGDVS